MGSKTGVELTEATGVVAGPDERKAAGGIWYPGDTVQAAIGQSDNLFTPIQLASYVSTLANGGTRYKAHFIDSIKSADYSETIFKSEPVVLNKINMSPESQAAVKRGMIMLGETYTPFRNLPYKVACKTGTAQVKKKIDGETVVITNGFMISYAPAENPQIAVVIAIENATSAGLASYVSEAYEAYFNRNSGFTPSQPENTIL